MTYFKKIISRFKNLSISRRISIVFTIFLLIIAQTFTILTVVSINNIPVILSNFKFPSGPSNLNIDIYNPEDMIVEMPYEIDNPTAFEISEITAFVNISIKYTRQSDQANISSYIFSKSKMLGTIRVFYTLIDIFEGDFNYFNITALINYFDDFDPSKLVYFYLHVGFSLKYFFNLMNLKFFVYNILLI